MKKNITIIKVDTNCNIFKTKGDFSEEISRVRFPSFDWNGKTLKKITWFKVFKVKIGLFLNDFFSKGFRKEVLSGSEK